MTKISLIKGDITKLKVECIINASNESGLGCSIPNHCIDSAIHFAAGPLLFEECKKLGGIPTGIAKITNAYNLPCKYIIHVTGPQKTQFNELNFNLLSQCYWNCMDLASKNKIHEIAFCCISTGLFGYPKKESAHIAVNTIKKWILTHPNYTFINIIFDVFTEEDDQIYKSILFS